MDESLNGSLNAEKQRAAERMRKMHELSKYRQSEYSPTFKQHQQEKGGNDTKNASFLSDLRIPGISNLNIDSDIALILGLVLILASEKSDRMLLLALLYILL